MPKKYIKKFKKYKTPRYKTVNSGSYMLHEHTISFGITTDIAGTDGAVYTILL